MADLVGAVRLPEGSMRATAGTEVVIDVLVFQRRAEGQAPGGPCTGWTCARSSSARQPSRRREPERGPARRTTCDGSHPGCRAPASPAPRRRAGQRVFRRRTPRWCSARTASAAASTARVGPTPAVPDADAGSLEDTARRGLRSPARRHLQPPPGRPARRGRARLRRAQSAPARPPTAPPSRKAAYHDRPGRTPLPDHRRRVAVPVTIKDGSSGEGHQPQGRQDHPRPAADPRRRARRAARPGRRASPGTGCRSGSAAPIRVHPLLRADQPHRRLDADRRRDRRGAGAHRRPNLAPFADDPDCWLVASIEDYDLDTGLARMGPIFRERVIVAARPPRSSPPRPTRSPSRSTTWPRRPRRLGRAAGMRRPTRRCTSSARAVFRNPMTEQWETADAYLSGPVRHQAGRRRSRRHAGRTIRAQRRGSAGGASRRTCRPPNITARLGAPWLPTDVIEEFVREVMGDGRPSAILHTRGDRDLERRRRSAASPAPPQARRNGARRAAMPGSCCTTRSTAPRRRSTTSRSSTAASGGCSTPRRPRPPRRSSPRSRPPSRNGSGPTPTAPTASPASTTIGSTTWSRVTSTAGT